MKKGLVIGLVILVVIIVIVALMILSPGSPSTPPNQSNQTEGVAQQPTCDQDFVGAWWLVGNQVYFIVEPDCSISKFCDLIEDIHTTGSIQGNQFILAGGAITNEIVLNSNTSLTILGGSGGIDLPFTRIYREYGIDPIPEDC